MTKEERMMLIQEFGNSVFDHFLRHPKIVNCLNKFEAQLSCNESFTEGFLRVEDLGDDKVATLTIDMDFVLANLKHGDLINDAFVESLAEKFNIKKRPYKGEFDL